MDNRGTYKFATKYGLCGKYTEVERFLKREELRSKETTESYSRKCWLSSEAGFVAYEGYRAMRAGLEQRSTNEVIYVEVSMDKTRFLNNNIKLMQNTDLVVV